MSGLLFDAWTHEQDVRGGLEEDDVGVGGALHRSDYIDIDEY